MTMYYSPAEVDYVEYQRQQREREEAERRRKSAVLSAKVIPLRPIKSES